MQLDDKRAFISGATQGIGFAIAQALLSQGAEVVINGRDQSRVDDALHTLRTDTPHAKVSGLVADFADSEQVHTLLTRIGKVDILVNNVGVFEIKEFSDIDDADWDHYLDVNLMSGTRLSRHLLPQMLEAGWGRILFISSESGVNIPADMIHYGVTKAATLALGNGLAKLTRGTQVTVNSILGGPTLSDGVHSSIAEIARAQDLTPDQLQEAIIGGNTTTLLQRFIKPREIASLATYLASPLSSATNGAAIRADGGVLTGLL